MLSIIRPWQGSQRGTEPGAACLSCNVKLQAYLWVSVPGASASSPAPKMRMYADSTLPEEAMWENCCASSSAHGTARTEAQSLGLLVCLATSKFQCRVGRPCRASPVALLQICGCFQRARSQKGLAWKAVAQPHLPMALLAQRHRAWSFLFVLPPETSNVTYCVRAGSLEQPCSQNANVCR